MNQEIPLSLYVHIPWCVRKCPYCDFNSHTASGELAEVEYIQALLTDLEQDKPLIAGRVISTIFVGGGTPSLFSGDSIKQLLDGIRSRVTLADDVEITLEANPGTVEYQRFVDYFSAGVNRLSIGVQSFNEQHLKVLGRIHSGESARQAIDAAHAAGFKTFNVDLMYALPEQSIEQAITDLETAFSLSPTHLSWYQLTLEPNTVFYKKPPPLPNDDKIADMEDAGRQVIRAAGFEHYEVSAYACPSHQCQHNLNYWEFGDYLGIGAGAHSKITLNQTITRQRKVRLPNIYLNPEKEFTAEKWCVPDDEVLFEFMLNQLRLTQYFSLSHVQQRTGLSPAEIIPYLELSHSRDFIRYENKFVTITETGKRYLNDLTALFLEKHIPNTVT